METNIFTRQDYLSSKDQASAHRKYYSQFVTPSIKMAAVKFLVRARKSTDEHLNDLPMAELDHCAILLKHDIAQTNKRIGNGSVWSYCDGVCAIKEAIRQELETEDK